MGIAHQQAYLENRLDFVSAYQIKCLPFIRLLDALSFVVPWHFQPQHLLHPLLSVERSSTAKFSLHIIIIGKKISSAGLNSVYLPLSRRFPLLSRSHLLELLSVDYKHKCIISAVYFANVGNDGIHYSQLNIKEAQCNRVLVQRYNVLCIVHGMKRWKGVYANLVVDKSFIKEKQSIKCCLWYEMKLGNIRGHA